MEKRDKDYERWLDEFYPWPPEHEEEECPKCGAIVPADEIVTDKSGEPIGCSECLICLGWTEEHGLIWTDGEVCNE